VSGDDIHIVAGGDIGAPEREAIVEAVLRVLSERDRRRAAPASSWARAGRLEASGSTAVRSRAGFLGT
jgi:hypothetical protein